MLKASHYGIEERDSRQAAEARRKIPVTQQAMGDTGDTRHDHPRDTRDMLIRKHRGCNLERGEKRYYIKKRRRERPCHPTRPETRAYLISP
jgi:hypothetical protein